MWTEDTTGNPGNRGSTVATVPWWLEEQDETKSPSLRTWLLVGGVVAGGIITGCLLWRSVRSDATPVAADAAASIEPAVDAPVATQTVMEVAPAVAVPAAVEVTAVAPTTELAPVVVVDG
jgi:hypothetical protein